MQDKNPFDQFDNAQTIPLAPPDPRRPLEVRKLQGDISRQAQQSQSDAALLPAQKKKAEIDAAAAALELQTKQRELAMQTPVDPKVAASIKGLGLDELLLSIQAARKEIGSGRATGVIGAILRMIPGTTANDLSGSINSIQGATIMEKLQALKDASKTGASGMGALSEREGARLADSIAALNTNLSDAKLKESLATIERHALSLKAVAEGKNPDDPAVQKEYGIAVDAPQPNKAAAAAPGSAPGPGNGGSGPANPNGGAPSDLAIGLSKDGTQVYKDPALAGANAHVQGMIRKGRSVEEINAYLEQLRPGLSKNVANIPQWVKFAAQHPDKPINVNIEETGKPLTPLGSMLNSAAQSPFGAGIMGAADILTGGTLDNMTGNPALARAGMAGVTQEHPYATMAGQVGGSVLAGLGAEGALARAGAPALAATLGGDALPGIAYGAGSADEGDRLAGAAGGGLAGLVGGQVGRGLGRVVSGVGEGAVRRLADRGIRMTPGQMLGGVPKRLEDMATSIPGLGDIIRRQRTNSVEDFNRAAFGEALQPIGEVAGNQIGENAVGNAENLIGQAYRDALGGARVSIDPQFGTDLGAAVNTLGAIPRVGGEVSDTIGQVVPPYFGPAGELTGDNMQPMLRELRDIRGGYRTDPLGNRVANGIRDVEGAVTGMFQRQAPEVMPAFNNANEAYSRFATLQDAVLAGKNQGGRFMPSQLNNAAVANTKRYAGKGAAARGDRAFFDLGRDAQDVLPSQLPDSGTASRLMLPGALATLGGAAGGAGGYANGDTAGGAGKGVVGGLSIAAALSSPYATRALIQRLLTAPRPVAVEQLGRALGQSRLPGALALPLLSEGP